MPRVRPAAWLLAASNRWIMHGADSPLGCSLHTDAPCAPAPPHPGRVFLVGTKLDGRHMLRLAIGAADVQPHHIHAAWDVIRGALDGLAQAQA